jgi:O-antigen/teichoic acid export membrane protein
MVKKNFFYYLSPSVLTGIISLFIIVPVSTYYLEPKDFGIIGIITVFSTLVVPLSSTGIGWVLPGNYYKINAVEKGELIFNMLFLGMLLRAFWVVIFGVSGSLFLPKFIKSYEPVFLSYFWIFLLAEWFNYTWQLTAYTIMLQKKGKIHAFLDTIKIVSRVAVLIICLAVFGLKVISLAWAYLAAALSGFVFSVIYIRKYIVPHIKMRWIKEIAKLGFPTIPLNLFEIISNSIGRFFIERWIGLSRLGIYTHSLDYKKAFMLPHRAFLKSYAPGILEVFSKRALVDTTAAKNILKKWFGLLALVGVFISLFSREAINILTHGKFIDAAPLVSLWFIIILIYTLGISYNQFLLANKKNKFIFCSEIILGIISWGIIALFVKFYGIIGATVSVLLYFFILYLVRKIYAMRLGCENFERQYFNVALIMLLLLIYLVNVFLPSLLVKILILLLLVSFILKYYDLFSLKILKQRSVRYVVN